MTELLGLPLHRALAHMEEKGLPTPRVLYTASPKSQREAGTLRVVAAQNGNLTVARFLDAMPEANDQAQA